MNAVWRNRLLGIAFVAVLAAGVTLSVLQYRKAFTPVDWVTLDADHTGMQLSRGADVKLYGVVVGDVRAVSSDGSRARLRLALDPDLTDRIPANVTARLLPKTLFGERYVALVPPAEPASIPIRDGARIGQDHSSSAIELERVLDGALPLLQSIHPDKLASTLAAVATALDGRGEQLGATVEALDTYLKALNPELPTLMADVQRLATVLDTYEGALPDLLSILNDITVTATTVTDHSGQLAALWADATRAADTGSGFLGRHGEQLIRLGDVSRPVLELLAAYAPEFPCLMQGLVTLQPRVEQVFVNGRMHITLEITRDNGKYVPGRDAPVYGANDGPNCRGLPNPPAPAPQVPINDGYDYGANRPPAPPIPVGPIPAPGTPVPPAMGTAGTPEESSVVKPIVGAATGVPPAEVPDIALILWGPLLRGAVVSAT
ncbi:ABC transporter substrate-binding protein [Virgisporangium aliadipatigenens]|uniref:ABC transporter substrate-binding protein n=1 Tax=Virgisporangium aliadipatigenens TaxID=741659 RepID=A0A8J4DM24_9ACTN|nr:MCE family protein [Virgisporangium aliadipatigenens]GIJ43330.1 ABC transporter substrate-binding protein [Virgisporangium aliadipatigenens]